MSTTHSTDGLFSVNIQTSNAAFEDDLTGEISRILYKLAERIETGQVNVDKNSSIALIDINGNTVGFASFTEE